MKCDHMGRADVTKHCATQSHLDKAKALQSQSRLTMHTSSSTNTKLLEAEVKFSVLAAFNNIPLAFHDHLSPMIRNVFPDSDIASHYHSASTKSTCILNLTVAPVLQNDLVLSMQSNAFSLAVDSSNDSGLEKMNPLTVRIFDVDSGKIVMRFLDMCTTSSSTAAAIYEKMDGKLIELLGLSNPWINCTSVGVDNASVNIGVRNSLKSRVLQRNPAIYFSGCPCHILHIASQKSAEAFSCDSKFDVEEFVIDLYYWFDKSTKRKNTLQSYCVFCDHECRSVVKHVSTRWLSLELAVERALKQFSGLKVVFFVGRIPECSMRKTFCTIFESHD